MEFLLFPKKGKRNKLEQEGETSEEFIKLKQKHSAVDSGINGLENYGLDCCLDHGIIGFKRYVRLAVLARNLQIIGNHLYQKDFMRFQRSQMDEAAA